MTELDAANKKEKEAQRLRKQREERDEAKADDSGTETEGTDSLGRSAIIGAGSEGGLIPGAVDGAIRKRRSLGEASASEMSTDSEWDKLEEAGEMDR